MWEQPQGAIQLSDGESQAGVQVIVPQGVVLNVQLNDPASLLLPVAPTQAAQASDTQLDVSVRQMGRLTYRVPFVSQGPTRRNYSLVVPAETTLFLTVQSPQASVVSQSGQTILGESSFLTPSGAALAPFQFTIQHN